MSPDYYCKRIIEILSSDWADRVRIIKGYKKNASVTYDAINEICALENTKDLDELEKEYKETFDLFSKISDSSITYPNKIEQFEIDENCERKIIELLEKSINEPTLTEREKAILSIVNSGQQARVEESINIFKDPSTSYCPYCYQNVSESYKKELIESISKIINKDVDTHKNELTKLIMKPIEFQTNLFQQLNSDLVDKISESIIKCNNIIQTYNKLIADKINNTYLPIKIEPLGLNNNLTELNRYLQNLEALRNEFNNSKKARTKIQDKLLLINKHIACKKIKADYNNLIKQKQEMLEIDSQANDIQKEINQYNNKIDLLNSQKENVGIAIDSISSGLKYIFFSENCLSIELKNKMYYLKSYGHHVKPKDISCGERNIIGLCYFFTQIMQKRSISSLYNKEQFIVIDDPISSFDYENKIGMLSYLKAQIQRILLGHEKSKVIIMSHDLTTVFDLRKAMQEICSVSKTTEKTTFSILELADKSLKEFNDKRSEYSELLERVYKYANDKTGLDRLMIGNSMRRVLEAFSTFNYKRGIVEISSDPEILKYLGDKSRYFEALMYRLVLHGESHFLERIKSMHDGINFYDFISDDEKQKTARSILCMMYILNPEHIISHFRTIPTAIKDIRRWCDDIPKNNEID